MMKPSKGDNKHTSSSAVAVAMDQFPGHGEAEMRKTPPFFVRDGHGKRYVFYFEEGSPHFVEVEDDDVGAYLPEKIDELERLFRRVWREVFSLLRVVTSLFVLFVAELVHFLLHSVARTLVLGTLTAVGDHLLKPMLTLLFNSVLQPILALVWNVCNGAVHALDPVVRFTGIILSQVAMVLGAFRLVVINHNSPASYSTHGTSEV